ncbi:MAG: type II secretion system protein N [Arhodomonas sp.]|nr:type II secretion system protein N [Arhodomonas sp.]
MSHWAWRARAWAGQLWPSPGTSPPPPRSIEARAQNQGASIDITAITEAELFGQASTTADVEPLPEQAPTTQLGLTLKGVLASEGGEGLAIIATGGDSDRLYGVGGEPVEGAVIEGVYADRVILRRQGRREALPLPEGGLSLDTEPRGAQGAPSQPGGDTGEDTAGAERSGRTLARYRQRLQEDPGALQRMLQPAPVRDASGALDGFRVGGGDERLLAAAGLERGDVITAVDDIRLDDRESAMRALQRLGNASGVTLNITRNGNPRQLRLELGPQE